MWPYRAPQPIVGETSGLGLLTVIYSVATPVTSSAAFFHPPVTSCFQRTSTPPSPAAPALTPQSLASRLYRGTGNKSRPVFASLRRKVERRSWIVCFTAPVARRSVRFVATRRVWAMRRDVLGGTSSAATGRNQVDTDLSRAVAGCDGERQA